MPPRNLIIIFCAVCISFVCYAHALHNHYAGLVAEAMRIITNEHLNEVSERKLFNSAMNGMVEDLDEHSMFMAGNDYRRFTENMEQTFPGVGIQVSYNEEAEFVMVEFAIFDSPAYKAGLQSGDLIISVNGKDTKGLQTRDVVKWIKGEQGTKVNMGIRRDQVDDFTVDIERAWIKVASVKGDVRDRDGNWIYSLEADSTISYIRLEQFGDRSLEELKDVLENLEDGTESIILDLRGNPGGLLEAAVGICDLFVEDGLIVAIKGRTEGVIEQNFTASEKVVLSSEIDVAVLIDENSASASEIVAACLQDHDRAKVVGERSYGKGTVQNVIELERNKSLLKLTTASYWRPNGENIHRFPKSTDGDTWGVRPDPGCQVEMDDEQTLKLLLYRRVRELKNLPGSDKRMSKIEKVDDSQLLKAIEVLQQGRTKSKAA